MAGQKRAQLSQEYVEDDDFIDDGEDKKPKKAAAKKPPAKKAKAKKGDSDEDEDEEEDTPLAAGGVTRNAEGDVYVELSNTRRVTVRAFKKTVLIDIRETYEKDGKKGLPGKKGIALSKDQWETLKGNFAEIDAAIAEL
ncbi:activated RNA polymerase II transcriptional coactivator p15, partial [Phenoliferia sp. Uapishka_3]